MNESTTRSTRPGGDSTQLSVGKLTKQRYPQSAEIFQFVKTMLEKKFAGVRVIDQDVGQLLQLDPAECSNWKKGKKKISSVEDLNKIAGYLDVDPEILMSLSVGELNADEAVFEAEFEKNLDISPEFKSRLRNQLYATPSLIELGISADSLASFSSLAKGDLDSLNREIKNIAVYILQQVEFKEPPLYLPELIRIFPKARLQARPSAHFLDVEVEALPKEYVIYYPQVDKMTATLRFLLTRELCKLYLGHLDNQSFQNLSRFLQLVDSGIRPELISALGQTLAMELLLPEKNFVEKASQFDKNLILKLSEEFWVSKRLVFLRIRQIFSGML